MRHALLSLTVLIGALAPTSAFGATQRLALLIAAHDGGEDLPKLRYAGRDANRLGDVLVDVGGFSRSDIITVVDGDVATVRQLLFELDRRAGDAKARGDEVVVVVYYSGHAQDGRLRIGDDVLAMSELRESLENNGADVRLAFVDSCGAGALIRHKGGLGTFDLIADDADDDQGVRSKGARLAAPFVVKVDEALATSGQVIIASSSADEVSQESDEIQGSFFTHYLATGLRGDADRDSDGKVTLDEAYAYAYGRTVAATATTRAGAQHPTYAFDLKGAGDIVLTVPGQSGVVMRFPDELEGRYYVVDLDRQLFVAEVDKARGGTSTIAVPPGAYAIKKRLDSHLLIARVDAREKGTIVVDDARMELVSFADDYAKGSPITINDTIVQSVAVSFSLGLSGSAVVDVTGFDDGGLFPAQGLVVGSLRLHHLLRSQLGVEFDAGFGQRAAIRTVDGGGLGISTFEVSASQTQLGTAIMWEQPIGDALGLNLKLNAGPRLGALLLVQQFVGKDQPVGLSQQTFLTFTPGVVASLAWAPVSFAHLEVGGRASYHPYTVDALRHLIVMEGQVSLWLDL